jgi:hypothetical protein
MRKPSSSRKRGSRRLDSHFHGDDAFCFLFALLSFVSPLHASFEPLSVGARAAGMADAVTATADDVYSTYYNPAGLVKLKRPELGTNYARLFAGLSDNSQISRGFVGYAQPLGEQGKYGSLAADYITLVLPGLYQEETYGLSYACPLGKRWNLGGTAKLLKKTIGTDSYSNNAVNSLSGASSGQPDPILANGRGKTQGAFDLGLQYQMTEKYVLGAVVRNLNEPNMALGNDTDPAPRFMAVGAARKTKRSTLSVEAGQWKAVRNQYQMNFGVEQWLGDNIGLRAGYAFGSQEYSMASFGASYRFSGFEIDYAMNTPIQGVAGTAGDQQFSFTVRFGKPPADPEELKLMQERQRRLEAQDKALTVEAERNKLKGEMEQLTRVHSPEPREAVEPAPLDQSLAQMEKTIKPGATQAKTTLAWYVAAVESYNTQVRNGATLLARQDAIRGILQEFNGKVDLSMVKGENASLENQIRKARTDYVLTLKYYEEFVKEGATPAERKTMLEKILLKFESTGLDMNSIQEEVRTIQKLIAAEGR